MTTLDDRLEVEFGAGLYAVAPALANSEQVRTVFNGFPAAVGVLCAEVDGEPRGMVATSLAVGVSYDPPMVLFSVRNDSSTWPLLRRSSRIGISVLSEDQGIVCRQIAAKDGDRFSGLETKVTDDGSLFVDGALTWMDCEVAGEMPAGDHTVVTFLVHTVSHCRDVTPLIFHNSRFPRLLHD